MLWLLTPLGDRVLSRRELENDKSGWKKVGSCAVGEKALYLGSRYISRRFYIPWSEVTRVFKRVAMSPGGFSGKGVFGSMAYLVVQYGKGREKQCHLRREAEVDAILTMIGQEHPGIPTHSAAADKKLAEAEAEERRRFGKKLSAEGEETLSILRDAREFLGQKPELSRYLTAAAKQKRIVDQMKPSVLFLGAAMVLCGMLLALFGVYRILAGSNMGWYFVLGGGAMAFFAMSANIVPGRWTSKKNAQKEWDDAVENCRSYIAQREPFPVPARYAHTTVLDRMIRVVREGRADNAEAALEAVKSHLRALNASVTVSQQEHDEVVDVKPLFLVCDYK